MVNTCYPPKQLIVEGGFLSSFEHLSTFISSFRLYDRARYKIGKGLAVKSVAKITITECGWCVEGKMVNSDRAVENS